MGTWQIIISSIQVNTSSNDSCDIVNAVLGSNEMEVFLTSEEGTESQNIAAPLPSNSSPPSSITVPPTSAQPQPSLLLLIVPAPARPLPPSLINVVSRPVEQNLPLDNVVSVNIEEPVVVSQLSQHDGHMGVAVNIESIKQQEL